MLQHLSFSGGGIYGISYCGVIKALEEHKLIDNINIICGTSAGSIVSTMLVLGYNSNEIEELINGLKFDTIRNITTDNIFGFFDTYGVDSGNKLITVIDIIIKGKTQKSNISFQELYEITQKKLVITGTNLSKRRTEYFDHINNPDMAVSLAIRISMGIPILFSPIKYENSLYIDGCILDNFPIHILPNDDTTLGITLKNTNKNSIENIEDYIFTIISCLTCEFEKLKTNEYAERILTIQIPENISPINFDISDDNKKILLDNGYKQTLEYLEKIKTE